MIGLAADSVEIGLSWVGQQQRKCRRFGTVEMLDVTAGWNRSRGLKWLVRRRGRYPDAWEKINRDCFAVLDHCEWWAPRDGSERLLVSHPYRFDEEMRVALVEASG